MDFFQLCLDMIATREGELVFVGLLRSATALLPIREGLDRELQLFGAPSSSLGPVGSGACGGSGAELCYKQNLSDMCE